MWATKGGSRPDVAVRTVAQPNAKISYHVPQHVEARDIHRPERCAFGTSERRPGDGVDLLDRVLACCHLCERAHECVEADVIADEVRRVLGNHDALAQTVVGKMRHRVHDLRQAFPASE